VGFRSFVSLVGKAQSLRLNTNDGVLRIEHLQRRKDIVIDSMRYLVKDKRVIITPVLL